MRNKTGKGERINVRSVTGQRQTWQLGRLQSPANCHRCGRHYLAGSLMWRPIKGGGTQKSRRCQQCMVLVAS